LATGVNPAPLRVREREIGLMWMLRVWPGSGLSPDPEAHRAAEIF